MAAAPMPRYPDYAIGRPIDTSDLKRPLDTVLLVDEVSYSRVDIGEDVSDRVL
jgi:hypothetical protein